MENEYSPGLSTVKDIKKETDNTNTYTIQFSDKAKQKDFSCKPGQFMMLGLFGIGEAAISVSCIKDKGTVEATIRNVGSLTNAISNLEKGDYIGMRGPYGTGWPLDEAKGKDVLIVAGGMGLAPLRGVITHIESNRKKYGHLEVIYGARTPDDMIFRDAYGKWRQIKNSRLDLTVDAVPMGARWECKIGLVTSCFPDMKTRHRDSIALICGPEIMMRYAAKCLETIGFNDHQIYLSLERRMKCGIGKCGHCQVGQKYVCKDGPVFDYSDVKPFIHPL